MKSPVTGKEMSIQKELRIMQFRKEEFEVLFHTYKCEDTGEQYEDETFSNLNYHQLVNQYRVKHTIPFPEQIKETREKYGLSAAKMSEILGFGVNSYRHYEAGEVPSQANANLIQLAGDPGQLKIMVEKHHSIKGKARKTLLHRIDKLIEEQKRTFLEAQLERYFFDTNFPDITTGYKLPNIVKLHEMIIFFIKSMQPWKTKLNKLLFYADFTMFKMHACSISGTKYVAIPLGPVPNNFQSIYEYLAKRNEFDINQASFSEGIGEQFIPNANTKFNADLFSPEEMEILDKVASKFKNISTQEIIEMSHQEKAWLENKDTKSIIDYRYGFDLLHG